MQIMIGILILLAVLLFVIGFRKLMTVLLFLLAGFFLFTFLGVFLIIGIVGALGLYVSYKLSGKKRGDFFKYYNFTYNGNINPQDKKNKYMEVLGVSENATDEEIKAQYKKLAKVYHPDLNGDKDIEKRKEYEEKFKEINEAYDALTKNI